MFRVPYSRPDRLTVLRIDGDEEECNSLLEKADSDWSAPDYAFLFQVGGPGGSYTELAYFLPTALESLQQCREEAGLLACGVLWFVDHFSGDLARDMLLDVTHAAILELVTSWMADFRVVHLDQQELARRGSPLPFLDVVLNSQEVGACLERMLEYPSLNALGHLMFSLYLNHTGAPVRSLWFAELVRQYLEGDYDFGVLDSRLERACIESHIESVIIGAHSYRVPNTYRDLVVELLRLFL